MYRILLIEDNELSRLALSRTFEDEGYYVDVAENGIKGVELFKRERYDIVITDLLMPGMDGYTVLDKVRELDNKKGRRPVPVIILSGNNIFENLNDTGVYYFRKPFDMDLFLEKIKSLLVHV